jgi:hypothetical protein
VSSVLRWALVFVVLAVRPLGPACGRADEFQCEEAAQHLSNCCGASLPLHCTYEREVNVDSTGCGVSRTTVSTTTTIEVDLQPAVAACLLGRSCEEIRSSGACTASGWLLPAKCSTKTGTCLSDPSTGMISTTDCTQTIECNSPTQTGICASYRQNEACDALRKLTCD